MKSLGVERISLCACTSTRRSGFLRPHEYEYGLARMLTQSVVSYLADEFRSGNNIEGCAGHPMLDVLAQLKVVVQFHACLCAHSGRNEVALAEGQSGAFTCSVSHSGGAEFKPGRAGSRMCEGRSPPVNKVVDIGSGDVGGPGSARRNQFRITWGAKKA